MKRSEGNGQTRAVLLIQVLFLAVAFGGARANAEALVNPFSQEGTWYKTALHVHSTTSDGDASVSERMNQYRKRGYDAVAITDHWKTNNIAGLSDERFLVMEGMEAHPKGNHFVCLSLPEDFVIDQKIEPQATIDMVNAAGGAVIYAHPFWLGHTIDNMLSVKGYIGVEVYNAVCDLGISKGYNNVHWQQLLEKGVMLPAVATDDAHSGSHVNHGWTMVKAKELSAQAIMDSLRAGCYYASCGPVIKDFRVEEGTAKIACSRAAVITFVGPGPLGARIAAKKGRALTTAEWKLPKNCKFVRVEVVDKKGRFAWTNPIVVE